MYMFISSIQSTKIPSKECNNGISIFIHNKSMHGCLDSLFLILYNSSNTFHIYTTHMLIQKCKKLGPLIKKLK